MSRKAPFFFSFCSACPPAQPLNVVGMEGGREERKSIPGYEGQFMRPALFEKGAANWERASRKKGAFRCTGIREREGKRPPTERRTKIIFYHAPRTLCEKILEFFSPLL